jgi:hypothetical protein
MTASIDTLTFDCADVMRVARFWTEALGWELDPDSEPDGAAVIGSSGGAGKLYLQPVPEPKVAKNRLHIDPDGRRWRGSRSSARPSSGGWMKRAASGP